MSRDQGTQLISPATVLKQVAAVVPAEFRHNIIIIGSLAAGYHFFGDNPRLQVRTKDIDCLLSPRVKAIPAAQAVTDRLFAEHWQLRSEGGWGTPGDAHTPEKDLPVVRLHPPESSDWFLELLTVPESESDLDRKDIRLVTSQGHFSLCSFGFLSLAEYEPSPTPFGIAIARPETMALANLLHHPAIGAETMSGAIGGRSIKRSNKDLGRVLALAILAERRKEDSVRDWVHVWEGALKNRFPKTWRRLTARIGTGLQQILEPRHELDLDEARHTCAYGLLHSDPPSLNLLRVIGQRLIDDVIEPMMELGQSPP
jgi:hypothetical protein